MAVSEYDKALIARTRQLREALGWSQQKMADALNIPGTRYRTYEMRGPLPYELLKPFAELTGASIEFVVTGDRDGRPQSAGPRKNLTGKERDDFMRIMTKLLDASEHQPHRRGTRRANGGVADDRGRGAPRPAI